MPIVGQIFVPIDNQQDLTETDPLMADLPQNAFHLVPAKQRRVSLRLHRLAAVLALCCVVLPTTGFWMNGDDGRAICAVRMHINDVHTFDTRPDASPAFFGDNSQSARLRDGANEALLFPNRARYRATLQDIPKGMHEDTARTTDGMPKKLLSVYGDQVALALSDATYMPLRRINSVRPSQTYRFWVERGTFLPADGLYRNADSMPIRWLTDANYKPDAECESTAGASLSAEMKRILLRLKPPFAPTVPYSKSVQYLEHIEYAAKRFGLSPRLIYAIMRTESAFNPFAVSNAGALGLMQVVPGTAGNEVQAYLTGKAGVPATSMLFDPQSNIEYGSVYLHLLATRYFAGVANTTSRELCMIAGYNAGPRAVFRAFNANNADEAIAAINAISPDELFTRLSLHMPAEETRQYVGKVVAALGTYPG